MIGPYFDTRPCDISILGYMLSGLLYPRVCFRLYVVGFIVPTGLRVWVLEEQTRTRKPDGYEVYPIKKPAGIEFSLCTHPNGAKNHRVSGFGYPLPSLITARQVWVVGGTTATGLRARASSGKSADWLGLRWWT